MFNRLSAENIMREQASYVATLILRGEDKDIDEAFALVKKNPNLVHISIIASDPLRRPVKGTLLQIAVMAGDINLEPEIKDEKMQGAVERLIAVAGLSQEEVMEQLKVVTAEESIRENEARNQQILDAIKRFGEGIIALESKEDNAEQFKISCKPLIEQLEKDLALDSDRVITAGYIFDPKILDETLNWYGNNLNRFSEKERDVFIINGYGKLQTRLSSRDAQITRHGVGYFSLWEDSRFSPRRKLNDALDNPYFYDSLSRLGIDFCFSYYGLQLYFAQYIGGGEDSLYQIKNTALQTLIHELLRPPQSLRLKM